MIDADIRLGEVSKIGSLTFTSAWLLHKTWFGFTTVNLSEVVWAYKKKYAALLQFDSHRNVPRYRDCGQVRTDD
jgi:hypothetical protein